MFVPVPGRLFDGQSSCPVDVTVIVLLDRVQITRLDDGSHLDWLLDGIACHDNESQQGVLQINYGNARLIVSDKGFRLALRRAAPRLEPRSYATRAGRALGLFVTTAVAAVLVWWSIGPAARALAALVPVEREQKIGDSVISWLQGIECSSPEGDAALNKLVERLTEGQAIPYQLRVGVIKFGMENAFAAPGGRIVFFSRLLDKAETPDEVAGVLAHELTHTIKGHPMIGWVRASVTGTMMTLFTGVSASIAETMMLQGYSRRDEAEADEGAIRLLKASRIGTQGYARVMDRFAEHETEEGGIWDYLSSHPDTRQRAKMARLEDMPETRPALTDTEWAALKAICNREPSALEPQE